MRNLFFRLPYNSETHYDIKKVPRESRYWDINTYMLATIADLVMALDWHFVAANSKHAPKPPKPIQRPLLEEEIKKPKRYWPGKTIVDKGNSND
jgi:hypothetical protein